MHDQFGNSDADLERGDMGVMRRKEDCVEPPRPTLKHQVDFAGRVDGTGQLHPQGEYIALDVTPEHKDGLTYAPERVVFNISQATSVADSIKTAAERVR